MLTLDRIEELKDIRRRTRADFDGYAKLAPEVWTREVMASANGAAESKISCGRQSVKTSGRNTTVRPSPNGCPNGS